MPTPGDYYKDPGSGGPLKKKKPQRKLMMKMERIEVPDKTKTERAADEMHRHPTSYLDKMGEEAKASMIKRLSKPKGPGGPKGETPKSPVKKKKKKKTSAIQAGYGPVGYKNQVRAKNVEELRRKAEIRKLKGG